MFNTTFKKTITNQIILVNLILFGVFNLLRILPNSILDSLILYYPTSGKFYPWQFITHQFLHGGFMHIFFNMIVLYQFGNIVESEFNRFFRRRSEYFYLYCYLAFGIVAALTHMLISGFIFGNVESGMLGASGCIYSLLTLYCLLYPENKLMLFFIIPMKSKWLLYLAIAGELIGGLMATHDGVGHWAHLGGILAGFIFWKTYFKSVSF